MPEILGGQRWWRGGIDQEGHRTYYLGVQTVGDAGEGPASHLQTAGLPRAGSVWAIDSDLDIYAWCTGENDCKARQEDNVSTIFDHKFTYTTKPRGQTGSGGSGGGDDRGDRKKCADQRIEDPLLEPPSTSGGTIRYTEEADKDRFGKPLKYTSFEQIRGPKIEFDKSRGQVSVEHNVINLELEMCEAMRDTVSDAPLWGLARRCWKLSDFTWSRKLYGVCNFYYNRKFTFEANVRKNPDNGDVSSAWDKEILDESSKVLYGHWEKAAGDGNKWIVDTFPDGTVPDRLNPAHYILCPDPKGGGNIRVVLSRTTRGTPAISENDANYITVEKYGESNFLLLGIPLYL